MSRSKEKDFEDYSFTVQTWPLIPEGIYQAQCIHAKKNRSHHNSEKLFLHFKIIEGKYSGETLFMAINLTDNKGRLKKKFGISSKLYKNWLIANHNKPPQRSDRLSTRIFKNGIFKVQIRTVKPKGNDGRELPEHHHYSVVDELIERLL